MLSPRLSLLFLFFKVFVTANKIFLLMGWIMNVSAKKSFLHQLMKVSRALSTSKTKMMWNIALIIVLVWFTRSEWKHEKLMRPWKENEKLCWKKLISALRVSSNLVEKVGRVSIISKIKSFTSLKLFEQFCQRFLIL